MQIASGTTGFLAGIIVTSIFLMDPQHDFNSAEAELVPTIQYGSANVNDLEWLAKTIYFEARGESTANMTAVGLVIMNRMKKDDRTVQQVVTQGKQDRSGKMIRNKCQFSFYCDGKSDEPKDAAAYERAKVVAQGILEGRTFDFTDGATHYHADYVKTNWGMSKVTKIDRHIFYRSN